MERLTERLENGMYAAKAPLYDMVDKLGELEDAEENGLLLRVPCKVGDTVYFLWRCSDLTTIVHPATVKSLSIGVYMLRKTIKYKIEPLGNCGMIKIFYSSDWGHRIFTTKEEADKALEVENALRTSTAERVLHELTMQAMFED